MTGPGLLWIGRDVDGVVRTYVDVACACLPDGHDEKIRAEKVGKLSVTFPDWKWNRRIDLPVVTI